MVKRMRTIYECLTLVKQVDADSCLTYNAIRTLCDEGKVMHVKIGKKYLVNYDSLLALLFGTVETAAM